MQFKNSEWLTIAVVGTAAILIVLWLVTNGENDTQYIDTKSIQINQQ